VAVVYALAFVAWYRHQPEHAASLGEWLARWPAYSPAALAVLVGLVLPVAWLEDDEAGTVAQDPVLPAADAVAVSLAPHLLLF
jgi:hypothetical protein